MQLLGATDNTVSFLLRKYEYKRKCTVFDDDNIWRTRCLMMIMTAHNV